MSSLTRVILKAVFFTTSATSVNVVAVRIFQRGFYDTWAGYADINHGIRFARSVKRTRHKRIVFYRIAEHDDFRAAEPSGVISAVRLMVSPASLTASILIP